jgi:hypothetical protein
VVALVSVETVLLVLLIVLVAALLRSHAELLRRLGPEGEPRVPAPRGGIRTEAAPEIAGATPGGDAIKLSFDGAGPTLLAFLSTGCTSCAGFFDALGDRRPLSGVRNVIVTRGADREQRSKLRSLAPADVPVLMSSQAWEDYSVPGSPYFVLIEDGAVRGEGVATTWDALTSLVADAVEEQREERDLEARLAAAGVGPDHPSLYPEGRR